MKVTINKANSQDNINSFSKVAAKFFRVYGERLLKELIRDSKDKLNLTLHGTYPRGARSQKKQIGFENAQVTVIGSNIINTNKGVRVQLRVRVTDGSSPSPHKIWHLLNKGYQAEALNKVRRFPVRYKNRTKPNELLSEPFLGYTGEWRSIAKGKRPAPVDARNWYKTAIKEIDKDLIYKYANLFDFDRKEAND